jgi:hypothetical protein
MLKRKGNSSKEYTLEEAYRYLANAKDKQTYGEKYEEQNVSCKPQATYKKIKKTEKLVQCKI